MVKSLLNRGRTLDDQEINERKVVVNAIPEKCVVGKVIERRDRQAQRIMC